MLQLLIIDGEMTGRLSSNRDALRWHHPTDRVQPNQKTNCQVDLTPKNANDIPLGTVDRGRNFSCAIFSKLKSG
jgi:hypothetical protein